MYYTEEQTSKKSDQKKDTITVETDKHPGFAAYYSRQAIADRVQKRQTEQRPLSPYENLRYQRSTGQFAYPYPAQTTEYYNRTKLKESWAGKQVKKWSTPYENSNWTDSLPSTDKSSKNGVRRVMDMNFDGDYLTANAYDINEKGDTLSHRKYKQKAYSGRNVAGEFSYSKKRQAIPNEGPTPEGDYSINPQKIVRMEDAPIYDKFLGLLGRGLFPGGSESWGSGRIEILPNEVLIDGVKRSGFTIHGGENPGSAGCIDLLDKEEELFEFLEKYRDNLDHIPLKVEYKK